MADVYSARSAHTAIAGCYKGARNARRCWQLLEEHRPQSARLHEVVQYPTEIERFVHRLASHIADLDAEVDLLIDYSSIPRRLLTQLLGRIAGTGPVESKLYRVRDLWLSYTWADSYPDAIKDEFLFRRYCRKL